MSLTIGDLAPNFTLPGMTSDGVKQISLSDYSGKNVILLFFQLLAQVFVQMKCAL